MKFYAFAIGEMITSIKGGFASTDTKFLFFFEKALMGRLKAMSHLWDREQEQGGSWIKEWS